jgi:hypothetical protein
MRAAPPSGRQQYPLPRSVGAATETGSTPVDVARPFIENGQSFAWGRSRCRECGNGELRRVATPVYIRAFRAIPGFHPRKYECARCGCFGTSWRAAQAMPVRIAVTQSRQYSSGPRSITGQTADGSSVSSDRTSSKDLSDATISELLEILARQTGIDGLTGEGDFATGPPAE